ncbi:unnamed protein product [Brassica oleracea var. botrytis]|uniref:Pentacotripeptide-repeat region of PRORP domain-containing protein n=2 Tax=Brassica oleracea TaxID=3712 RepID=A0A0D3CHW7_BRAOL|nr:unnamed protein product [Brassica oleracea]
MESKVKLNVVHYSMFVDSLCKEGSLEDALNLFNEMETKGIKVDVITYNTLIGSFCKAGRWDDGAQLLRDMITRGITPDVFTFDALDRLFGERGIAPDDCTYNTIIRAHLGGGGVATSAEIIEEMKRCGFSANASTMKMVIDMLSDGRLSKSFLDMLS